MLLYRLKGDPNAVFAWAVANSPEEAEVIFRRRLATIVSRFYPHSGKSLAAARLAKGKFEVERETNRITKMENGKWNNED